MTRLMRREILTVCFVLFSVGSFAQVANSGQLEFESAAQLVNKGAYAEALQQLDRLVLSGFDDDKLYKYRGVAKFNLQDFRGAAEDLDKARQKLEKDGEVLGLVGICKYRFQEWEAAKYFLINSISSGYKNSKAHLYLGYLHFEDRQYKDAIEQLSLAEKAGETEIKLFESRGIASYHEGDYQPAITDLEVSINATKKASRHVSEILGLAYGRKGNYDKALPHLTRADSLGSENKDVYFQLGNCLKDKGLHTRAIDSYTSAITFGYSAPAVYLNRGDAKVNAGLIRESLADFDFVIKQSPENILAYRSRANANRKLEDWPKVVTDLSIIGAFGDAEATDLVILSLAKYHLKNYQGALEDIDKALEMGIVETKIEGRIYWSAILKGQSLIALKQFEQAVSVLDKLVKTGNNSPDLYLNRARAFVGLHKFENAIADLEKAQLSDPKNADVFFNAAVIKEELGDIGAAILDYNKAIKLNPNDALAFYGRANCKGRTGDHASAVADLDESIKLDAKNPSYYKARGNYFYQMKNKDKACFDWRKAVEFGDEKARFSIEQYCNK